MAYICKKPKESCTPSNCAHCRWDEDRMKNSCWAIADAKYPYRKKLSAEEWNALAKLTSETHLDSVIDVVQYSEDVDGFMDFDHKCPMFVDLHDGLEILFDGLAYPLKHDNMDEVESHLIVNLFKEFRIITDKQGEWLLEEREE